MANHHPSRRQMLGLGAAACIPRVSSAADPDAELLDLCRQLDADSRDLRRRDHDPALEDGAFMVILLRAHDAIDQLAAMPAETGAGICAKARALGHALTHAVAVKTGLTFEEQAEDYELLAMSLVRDIGRVHHAQG